MFTSKTLLSGELPDVRVGIGRGSDTNHVESSVKTMQGYDVRIYDDPEALAQDLATGKIDAALRGDMPSSVFLPVLKKALGVDSLERIVFLEPAHGKLIILAPVGIDEGWTVDQKYDLAVHAVRLAKHIGMGTKIAVMSGGRSDDYGRCKGVDKSIDDADELVEKLVSAGYDAYNSQILIENAVEDADIVIAPNGIDGNLIFRTLHFLGGAKALGAPVVNIDKVYVDTSRVKIDYSDSIALAMKLTRE